MKKLVFIPLDYHLNPHQDWFKAFCNHFVTRYHTDVQSSIEFTPDFIFVQSGALEPHKLLLLKNNTGAYVIQWTGDCRDELLPDVMNYKGIADLTLLACGIAQKDMYESALGTPVGYLQHGVSRVHQMGPVRNFEDPYVKDLPKKITLIANNYSHFSGAVERFELCKLLSREFPDTFEVIGNGFNIPGINNTRTVNHLDTTGIYRESYISISANIFNDKQGYFSNRPLDIMISGGFCLMRHTPGIEAWFTGMEHCIMYSGNEYVPALIRKLISEPALRTKIAKSGQAEVLKNHTFESRVKEIVEHLKIQGKWE